MKKKKSYQYKDFPIELYKHGVRVIFGTYEDLKKVLNKDGFDGNFEEEKDLMEKSMGITFTLNTDDIVIWMRKKPKTKDERSALAHEIYHATSFLLQSIGIEHTAETEEAYAYAFEYLYGNVTSWAYS